MDLLSKFRVIISEHNSTKLLIFSPIDNPINVNRIKTLPTFKEDYSLNLNFKVNDFKNHEWKLFIPGIDDYHNQIDNLEINPNYNKDLRNSCKYYFPVGYHQLFDANAEYKRGKYENKPLTPNVYTVEVTDGDKWFYAHFIISAKELTLKEWSDMINEISHISQELNIKHIQWKTGLTFKKKHSVTREFADELVRLAPKIQTSLHFILSNFRFETAKKYRWVHPGQEKEIDFETLRKMDEIPVNSGKIYAPYRYLNYDIPDNRWIRFISFRILKLTILSLKYYQSLLKTISNSKNPYSYIVGDQSISEHQSEIRTLELCRYQLIKLRNYLNYVLNMSILNNISPTPPMFISKGLIYSAKYNRLYKLYLDLKQIYRNKLTIKSNQYRYKKTDKLYEFWIFIKIVEIFMSHYYIPIKGWGCGSKSDKWLLNPNTRVLMSNPHNNINIRLVYDDPIKKSASKYNEPLLAYGTPHNRPDIRIDIFHNKRDYWGSIILDAKYKELSHVIHEAESRGQLSSYATLLFSRSNKNILRNSVSSVPEVIALYPGSINSKNTKKLLSKYKTNLLDMKHLLRIKAEILRPDNLNSVKELSNTIWSLLDNRITTMEKLSPDYHVYTFYLKINDSNATATTFDGNHMTIKRGSKVASKHNTKYPHYKLFIKLRHENKINKEGYFTQDVSFNSPTKAGNMIYRHTISGRQFWITQDGKSINDIFGHKS